MTRRVTFDGSRQEQALRSLLVWSRRALRTRSGKTLKQIGAELGMSPATIARYLKGKTPLCSDQFGPFAAAFETTEAALIHACLATNPVAPADDGWTIRRALEAAGLPADLVDRIEADTIEWGEKSRRAAAEGHILLWRARQLRDEQPPREAASA